MKKIRYAILCLRKIFGIGHVCLRSFEKFHFEEWRRQRDGAEWVDPTDDPTKDDPTTDDRLGRVQTFSSQWIKSDERRNEWSWDAGFLSWTKLRVKKIYAQDWPSLVFCCNRKDLWLSGAQLMPQIKSQTFESTRTSSWECSTCFRQVGSTKMLKRGVLK